MTTNGSTSWSFSTNSSPTYIPSASIQFYSHTYYKSVDFGREMIMSKLTERHKENEGCRFNYRKPLARTRRFTSNAEVSNEF